MQKDFHSLIRKIYVHFTYFIFVYIGLVVRVSLMLRPIDELGPFEDMRIGTRLELTYLWLGCFPVSRPSGSCPGVRG